MTDNNKKNPRVEAAERKAVNKFIFDGDHTVLALFKATRNNLTMTARLLNVNKTTLSYYVYEGKPSMISVEGRRLTLFSDISRWGK